MGTDNQNAMVNARLQLVSCEMDAKAMSCWVEEIRAVYGAEIRFGQYQSVFRCISIDGSDVLIGAAGRLAGLRVLVSRSGITGEVDLDGKTICTIERKPESDFTSIPFEDVFSICNQLRDKLRGLITPEYYGVPILGGIKSILLREEPQVIADYYLPEIELFEDGGEFYLFTALHISKNIPLTSKTVHERKRAGRISSKTDCPDKPAYALRMSRVLDELKQDALQKVVVARKCTVTPEAAFDPCDYAAYLYDGYFQEYFYMFRQGEDACWVGISPEIIMKQKGRTAVTKPLAGTRKKSEDEALNAKILKDLISANKDIVEHEHALYFMVQQLEQAEIGRVRIDKNKTVLETPYAFHIKSEISMCLKEGVSCFDIIGAIYPPATVWGIPIDKTEHLLAETEPFDREYFTGVYGYWNYEGDADTALVIRSAKMENGTVSLYAGGGIVKYSDIDAEFDETVNKMRPLLSYFRND